MNSSKHLLVILIIVAFGAGSFVTTYAWPPSTSSATGSDAICTTNACPNMEDCRCIALWLQLSPEETQKLATEGEPFFRERPTLEAALYAERRKLADLFENGEASDEEILEQVERVIAANGSLERCVASYLVGLRQHLTEEQRGRLYQRCAKGVRNAGGCRWQYRDAQGGCGGCGSVGARGCSGKKGGFWKTVETPSDTCGGSSTRPACQRNQARGHD